jgi:hypothetical protein
MRVRAWHLPATLLVLGAVVASATSSAAPTPVFDGFPSTTSHVRVLGSSTLPFAALTRGEPATVVGLPWDPQNESWVGLSLSRGDERFYTDDGDWSPGYAKAECGSIPQLNDGFPIVAGVGSDQFCPRGAGCFLQSYVVLCANAPLLVNQAVGYTLHTSFGDARRSTIWGDWAPGHNKAECGEREAITGLSTAGDARCSAVWDSWPGTAASCRVLTFDSGDDREPNVLRNDGDWAPGDYKGECGSNRYAKGVARAIRGAGFSSILCCDWYNPT